MDKEEVRKLHEELNELSAFEWENLKRMVEIARILDDYYMWRWKTVKDAEKSSPQNEERNTA